MEERLRLVGKHASDHLDASPAESTCAPAGRRTRVGERVDHALDSGVQ